MKPKLQGLAGELLKLSEIVHLDKNQALIKVPEEHKSLLIGSVLKKLKDGRYTLDEHDKIKVQIKSLEAKRSKFSEIICDLESTKRIDEVSPPMG